MVLDARPGLQPVAGSHTTLPPGFASRPLRLGSGGSGAMLQETRKRPGANKRAHAKNRPSAWLPQEVEGMLRDLGEDPSAPNWQAAFVQLTRRYLRLCSRADTDTLVKHTLNDRRFISWADFEDYPAEERRGKWDEDSCLILIKAVSLLTRGGEVSERDACERVARDPQTMAMLPYAEQKGRRDAKGNFHKRAAAALRQQLHYIKNTSELVSEEGRGMIRRHLAGKYVSITLDQAAAEAEQRRKRGEKLVKPKPDYFSPGDW